jgi:phage tail-like protein
MPRVPESPYRAFNFMVSFGAGDDLRPVGGFAEVSGLVDGGTGTRGTGGAPFERLDRKAPGLQKVGSITLKRGVIRGADLGEWLAGVRSGGARRDVTIQLREPGGKVARSWKLPAARILKHSGPSLNAKGNDVAIEELTLEYERLTLED